MQLQIPLRNQLRRLCKNRRKYLRTRQTIFRPDERATMAALPRMQKCHRKGKVLQLFNLLLPDLPTKNLFLLLMRRKAQQRAALLAFRREQPLRKLLLKNIH